MTEYAIRNLDIEQRGYAVASAILDKRRRLDLVAQIEGSVDDSVAGVRALASRIPVVADLARSASLRQLVEPVLGQAARLVRSILFNKHPGANWQVGWHQDLTIAVAARSDVAGFSTWSSKEGVVHVQPPVAVLEGMLTVRLHLDAADRRNGSLWVSPGTHRLGRLPQEQIAPVVQRHGQHACALQAGDALLMRPLILHASYKSTTVDPRRVIHLEFAGVELPAPLRWAGSV